MAPISPHTTRISLAEAEHAELVASLDSISNSAAIVVQKGKEEVAASQQLVAALRGFASSGEDATIMSRLARVLEEMW